MNNKDWFIINDINELINSSRALVFNNFGKNSEEEEKDILSFIVEPSDIKELNTILSFDESEIIVKNLIKKQYHKTSKKIRYLLNDNIYIQIISDLNDRMVSNILNNLVNKGLVETAYDSDSNDFIFWIKEDAKETIEKPETD